MKQSYASAGKALKRRVHSLSGIAAIARMRIAATSDRFPHRAQHQVVRLEQRRRLGVPFWAASAESRSNSSAAYRSREADAWIRHVSLALHDKLSHRRASLQHLACIRLE